MLDEWKLLRVVGSAKDRCHGEPQELDGLGRSLNSANAFGAAGPYCFACSAMAYNWYQLYPLIK